MPAEQQNQLREESGFSVVEVLMALSLLAVGMLSLVGTMSSAGQADEAVRKRSLAFDAAHGVLQDIIADSRSRDFEDFVQWWGDPANQTFAVEGLENPLIDDVDASAVVAIDDTDSERVSITVTVSWSDLGRTESLSIPYTFTGLEQ